MREAVTEGVICVLDEETLVEYSVCDIRLAEREDGPSRWVLEPRWGVVDLLAPPLFQGIPGINLDLRLREYVREGRTPVFVSERAPSENREDVRALLEREGLDYLNKLEWLICTDTRYPGDSLYVRRRTAEDDVREVDAGDLSTAGARSSQAMRRLLEHMAAGRDVVGEGFAIGDGNRVHVHGLLRLLYLKEKSHLSRLRAEGSAAAAAEGRRAGRKPAAIDEIALADVFERYEKGRLSAREAASELGVSRATFFRRKAEMGGRGAAGE